MQKVLRTKQPAPPPLAVLSNRYVWIAAEILAGFFILTFTVPWQPALEAPIGAFDYSWMQVLHHAVATGMQFGKQIILPQGPLGFIGTSVYDPRTYVALIAVRSIIALLAFWSLRNAARKCVANAAVALVWMIGVILFIGRSPDHFFPGCAVLLLLDYFIVHDRKMCPSAIALILVLAASSLIKVNQPFYSIAVLTVISLDQARRRDARFIVTPMIYVSAWLLFYVLARQELSSLGAFLWGWSQVAMGHADAVGLPGPWIDPAAYLVVVAMIVALFGHVEWKTHRWSGMLPVAGVTAVLLLLYKHSFMRQDIAHVHMGPMVATATMILLLPVLWTGGGRILRVTSIGVLCVSGVVVSSILSSSPQTLIAYALAAPEHCGDNINAAASHLTDPPRLYRQWQAARQQLRDTNPLPLAKIQGTVDVYPHRQDVVLAYDLNYQPRPVISSLVATATSLADVNTRHLRGPVAAQTILFDVELVDQNYPTMLDGESLPELLARYDVIDTSGAMLVLRRSRTPRTYHFTPLTIRKGKFDQAFMIPWPINVPIWAQIRFKRRIAGRLLAAIYKPASMIITVHPASGPDAEYRLLPSLAEQGFLLSPLIKSRMDYARLASGAWLKQVEPSMVDTITLSVEDGSQEAAFEPEFEVELSRLEFSGGS